MLSTIQHVLTERVAARRQMARSRRRGVTAFLIAAATLVIFGAAALSVDYALLVNDKNQWQRACDAAALAGAQELKQSSDDNANTANASRIAIAVAAQNGVKVESGNIAFLDDNTKIRVESSNARALYFARVLHIPTGAVRAVAVAGITALSSSTPTAVPIGVTTTTVAANTVPTLNTNPVALSLVRNNTDEYTLNNFLVFDLRSSSAKSPTQMKNQLINGWPTQIGDKNTSLNATTGPVLSNFEEALRDRFQRSAQSPYNDTWTGKLESSTGIRYNEILSGKAPTDNPRIVYIIVNAPVPAGGGTTDHEVLALTPVYLEGWQNDQLMVRFLPASIMRSSTSGGTRQVSLLQ